MTIEDRERNTEIPLYYWIRKKGSINNVKSGMMLGYRPVGWHIATEVLKRYYQLKNICPTKENQFDQIICKAAYKYGSLPQFVQQHFMIHVVGYYEL
jgi:hypothetical protein